jgi:hypothetical protein
MIAYHATVMKSLGERHQIGSRAEVSVDLVDVLRPISVVRITILARTAYVLHDRTDPDLTQTLELMRCKTGAWIRTAVKPICWI